MFIPEKYLKGPNNDVTVGAEVKCKYCGREFIVPLVMKGEDYINVCEDPACKATYEKEQMAAKMATLQNENADQKNLAKEILAK